MIVVGLGVAIPASQAFLERILDTAIGAFTGRSAKQAASATAPATPETPQPTDSSAQNLPLEKEAPPTFAALWRSGLDARQPILDLIAPTYILNERYQIVDWNPAFDEIVAKPLNLRRGWHAGEFVRALKNTESVVTRAQKVFGGAEPPLVDEEILEFPSQKYGLIRFRKLACQISDEHGRLKAWCVHLNIIEPGDGQALWDDLRNRLKREVNWSRYARSYDNLLLHFDEYGKLLDKIVKLVGNAPRCIDIGAGTGNGTLRLLERADREVWAIDSNDTMLQYLQTKAAGARKDVLSRLVIIKEDIQRLDDYPPAYFDAAIMVNVLYAVEDPQRCLQQIHRMLKRGCRLVLSTSTRDTDLDRLFAAIEDDLRRKKVLDEFREDHQQARQRHEDMKDRIHRDTPDLVRQHVTKAGFRIVEEYLNEYVGAVMIVVAEKT
ncbi:MAG: class I SAM-dependent methyltransferase [Phycisphaerales bacterium]|nr:class I SAM-dependent methyltransferase [Phycisphaerales bacterium]